MLPRRRLSTFSKTTPPRSSYCQRLREQRLCQCLVSGFEPRPRITNTDKLAPAWTASTRPWATDADGRSMAPDNGIQNTKRAKGWELLRARDATYRDALGIKLDGELPKSLGVTTLSGGGRERRCRIEKPSKHDPMRRGRAKLIADHRPLAPTTRCLLGGRRARTKALSGGRWCRYRRP